MLVFEGIDVSIAGVHVLRKVSFHLPAGSTCALIGHNGAGKTTMVRTIMGFTESKGVIRLAGEDISQVEPHRRPALGIGYAPEDRRLFSAFTVEENVLLPARVAKLSKAETARRLEQAYWVMPELKELADRPAGSVSGGQGKMVALGRLRAQDKEITLLITESNPKLVAQFANITLTIERGEVEQHGAAQHA